MANYKDMYKMEQMSDPQELLNNPIEVYLVGEDETDKKKVYKQADERMKAIIKKKTKEAKEAKERERIKKSIRDAINKKQAAPANKTVTANKPATVNKPAPKQTALQTASKPTAPVNKPAVQTAPKPTAPVNKPTAAPKPTATAPPAPAENDINFYWVRHAESVANLYNNKTTDDYLDDAQKGLLAVEINNFLEQDKKDVELMKSGDTPLATEGEGNIQYIFINEENKNEHKNELEDLNKKLNYIHTIKHNNNYLLLYKNNELTGYIYGIKNKVPKLKSVNHMYISNVEIFEKGNKMCKDFVKEYIKTIQSKYDDIEQFFLYVISDFVNNKNSNVANINVSPACLCYIRAFNDYGYDAFVDDIKVDDKICYTDETIKSSNLNGHIITNGITFIKRELPAPSGGVGGKYPLVDKVYEFINKKVEEAKKVEDSYTDYELVCKDKSDKCLDQLKADESLQTDEEKASKFYALWLQNFNPSNFLFQPTLTQCGIVQASILGKQFTDKAGKLNKVNPDITLTSATVRTMMTAYLTLLYAGDTIKDKTIYVVPYLNEEENDAQKVFYKNKDLHDFCNYGIDPDKIAAVCETITNWFTKPERKIYDAEGKKLIVINKDEQIKFDYSLYKKNDSGDDIRAQSLDSFFTNVFDKQENLKTKKNVLVFSHYKVLVKIWEQLFQTQSDINKKVNDFKTGGKNTAVFQTKYTLDGGVEKLKPIYGDTVPVPAPEKDDLTPYGCLYFPTSIRENYKENNDKILQMDITQTEGQAGVEGQTGVEGQAQQTVEPLVSLQPGSLRGDIAWITHGDGSPPPIVPSENVLSKNVLSPETFDEPVFVVPEPTLNYKTNDEHFIVNKQITEISPEFNPPQETGVTYTFVSAPDLPVGLKIANETGIISGTPTVVTEETSYKITATNTATNAAVTFEFKCEVKEVSNKPYLEYSAGKITLVQGDEFPELTLVTENFQNFTIEPALPAGINLDEKTGQITGKTTVIQPETPYTISAAHKDAPTDQQKTTLLIEVTELKPTESVPVPVVPEPAVPVVSVPVVSVPVEPAVPVPAVPVVSVVATENMYAISNNSLEFKQGKEIDDIKPSDNFGTDYKIINYKKVDKSNLTDVEALQRFDKLPLGLKLDAKTGVISGTIDTEADAKTYKMKIQRQNKKSTKVENQEFEIKIYPVIQTKGFKLNKVDECINLKNFLLSLYKPPENKILPENDDLQNDKFKDDKFKDLTKELNVNKKIDINNYTSYKPKNPNLYYDKLSNTDKKAFIEKVINKSLKEVIDLKLNPGSDKKIKNFYNKQLEDFLRKNLRFFVNGQIQLPFGCWEGFTPLISGGGKKKYTRHKRPSPITQRKKTKNNMKKSKNKKHTKKRLPKKIKKYTRRYKKQRGGKPASQDKQIEFIGQDLHFQITKEFNDKCAENNKNGAPIPEVPNKEEIKEKIKKILSKYHSIEDLERIQSQYSEQHIEDGDLENKSNAAKILYRLSSALIDIIGEKKAEKAARAAARADKSSENTETNVVQYDEDEEEDEEEEDEDEE
jgi:hypothetical protein